MSHASGVGLRRAIACALAAGAAVIVARGDLGAARDNDKTIYVAALDPSKQPLTGLTADTWAIREDGKDRTVVASTPATDPLDIVLMVDTSVNAQPSILQLRAGLEAFARAVFAGPAPVTMSIMDVAAADVMVSDHKTVVDDVVKTLSKTFPDRAGNTVMLEGISDAAGKLSKTTAPRRAIVIVNLDGVPDASTRTMQDVIKAVLASRASVWAVTYQNAASKSINQNLGQGNDPSVSGSNGMVGTGSVGQNLNYFLSHGPAATGGLRSEIATPTAIEASLDTIARALLGQYALTYTRPDSALPRLLELGQAHPGATLLYSTTPIK